MNSLEQIEAAPYAGIAKLPFVRDKFVKIHDALWGDNTGEAAYERELIHFNKWIAANKDALERSKPTKFSVFCALIDLAVCGLSVETGSQALCYLMPGNVKIGTDERGNTKYECRLNLSISGYGELELRRRAGQIRHADNPVIVYAEDSFSFTDKGGVKSIEYTCRLPHASREIVACFIRITRADGTTDYSVMFREDWERLKEYSDKKNKKMKNELYTSTEGGIDPGFLKAKCIRHAFKAYPKVRTGKATVFAADTAGEEDYYSVETEVTPQAQPEPVAPFGHPLNTQDEGVTINTVDNANDDDGAF